MPCRISAVVCTHNRSTLMAKAVSSLIRQSLKPDDYEVIVVDNRSTDDTAEVVRQLQREAPHLHYVVEPTLGVNPARNRGWKDATASYVAYLDDDAVADFEWLEALLSAFEDVHPRPAAVGGRITPIWETARPAWCSDEMLGMLSLCDYSQSGMFLDDVIHRRNLVGANIAFTRASLERVGGFTPGLDRVGTNLLSGGELLVQVQLEDLGLPIYYEPRAEVEHLVPAERVTRRWLRARCYWGGISDALLVYFRGRRTPYSAFRLLLYAVRTLPIPLRVAWDIIRRNESAEAFDRLANMAAKFGFVVGALQAARLSVQRRA